MAGNSEGSRTAWAAPGERERRSAIIRAAMQRPSVLEAQANARAKRAAAVPKWVPRDLVEEYRDIAATQGEEAAASHCRRLKREMTEPSRSFGYCAGDAL